MAPVRTRATVLVGGRHQGALEGAESAGKIADGGELCADEQVYRGVIRRVAGREQELGAGGSGVVALDEVLGEFKAALAAAQRALVAPVAEDGGAVILHGLGGRRRGCG